MSFAERGMGGTLDRLYGTAKRNPEGVLLLAAGVALLMRGIGAATEALREDGPNTSQRQKNSRRGDTDDAAQKDLAGNARTYMSDVAGRVERSAENVAGYTSQVARETMDRTTRVASGTGSTMRSAMDRILDEQPLALALLGLAAGAAVAGALPSTHVEEGALRPLGRKLEKTVDQAGSRLKKSTKKAGRRLRDVADERGLNPEGLREAAQDVAKTFEEGILGEEVDRSATKKPSGASRAAEQREQKTASRTQLGSQAPGAASREDEDASAVRSGRPGGQAS
jgi:hypothetical protein